MSRFSSFFLGMATGAMLLHAATLFHVVRSSDGLHFVQKQPPRLSETYVDITSFTMTDWAGHPQLASALVKANPQQRPGESGPGALQPVIPKSELLPNEPRLLPVWPIAAALIMGAWIFFYGRSRPLARTIDRGEVAVLKPLSITYLIIAFAFALSGVWLLAIASVTASFLNGNIGASLHKNLNFGELAKGTIRQMQEGARLELSHEESFLLARTLLSAAIIAALLLLASLLSVSVRWYLAAPAAFLSIWLFLSGWGFIAAWHPKAANGAANGSQNR